MKRLLLIAAAAMVPAAFAGKSDKTYQPAADLNSPGYAAAPAEGGRHTVVYTGAKGMKQAQVAEYALLRAAELTTESGQEWFAVITTKSQKVQLGRKDDLQARSGGGIIGGESTGTGAGGAGGTTRPGGVSDSATRGGPSTGGFGGGDVPYQVLERWTPPSVHQTVIVIQMGKGDRAEFKGLDHTPQIFGAQTVADEIRGKMKK